MALPTEAPRGPLFIIGNPRSGTTLLRLLLTAHAKILIPPECGFVVWLHDKYRDWPRTGAGIGKFVEDLVACRKFDTWNLDASSLAASIAAAAPASYAELCRLVYLEFGARQDKHPSIWGDKNNFHTRHLQELEGIFPGALFLHIVRDGRDVACSYRQVMERPSQSPYAPTLPVQIGAIAREWLDNVSRVRAFQETLPPNRQRTIRYEDLVADPPGRLAAICQWLGLDFQPTMLEFHEANRRHNTEPALTLDWKLRTLEPASGASVGQHRSLLSSAELDEFHTIAGPLLASYGYQHE